MLRRLVPPLVATLLVAGVLAMVNAPGASAAPACVVGYTVNQWSNGFTTDVTVTNGGAAVTSWTLSWSFAGDQRITNGWNATVTQSGSVATATSAGWNGSLATGASATFGFQGTYSGTNTEPTAFTFNGVPCGGDPPTGGPTTSGPTTSTPPEQGCVPTKICDGFEQQTGTTPAGNWSVATPDCSGSGAATIDRTVAHSGTASLKIAGASGYCNHVFAKNSQIMTIGTASVWYVRYWVRHTTALPPSHVTAVAMTDSADAGKDLRFGGQNGALQFNRASDDATLPEQSPAGVALSQPLPVNTWNCVEFKVDGVGGTIETWLNGTAVAGLTEDGTPTHDIDSQWLNRTWRPRLADLKLGWESYGEGTDTLWYDDVVVAGQRNNC